MMVTDTRKRPGSRCKSFLFVSTCINIFHRIILYAITGCVSTLFCLVIIYRVCLILGDPLYLLTSARQFRPSVILSNTSRVCLTEAVPTLTKVGQESLDERCGYVSSSQVWAQLPGFRDTLAERHRSPTSRNGKLYRYQHWPS